MNVFCLFGKCQEEGDVCVCRVWLCEWHRATSHTAEESKPIYVIQFQIWKPCSRHPHPGPACLPHQFALASCSKLLSCSLFLPLHNYPPPSLLTLSDFSVIKLPCHLSGRQQVSSDIQDLPRGPENALTQWKTGLLKQLWDRRGNLKSALTCHILSEVKPAFNKSFRGQPKHFAKSRCLDDQKSQSSQTP